MGYRGYDALGLQPLFPFGHGLSYTSFVYSGVAATSSGVTVTVTNNGSVAGAEVPQLYLGFPAHAGEPPQQLRGFAKVALEVGQAVEVTFPLAPRDLSVWDVASHSWMVVQVRAPWRGVGVAVVARARLLAADFGISHCAQGCGCALRAESRCGRCVRGGRLDRAPSMLALVHRHETSGCARRLWFE